MNTSVFVWRSHFRADDASSAPETLTDAALRYIFRLQLPFSPPFEALAHISDRVVGVLQDFVVTSVTYLSLGK